MIKINDVTNEKTVFGDLEIRDCFIRKDVIWKKISRVSAVQITDYSGFLPTCVFDDDVTVEKIKITSIDYTRIK